MKKGAPDLNRVVAYLYETDPVPYLPGEHLLYVTIMRESDIPPFNRARTSAMKSEPCSRGVIDIPVKDIAEEAGNFVGLLGIEPVTWVGIAHIPSYKGVGEACKIQEGIRFAELTYDANKRLDIIGALERYAESLEC